MQKILKFTPAFALDFIYFFRIPPTSSVFVLSSLGTAQQILAVMVVLPPHCFLGGLHKKYKIFSRCLLSWRTTQKCKNLNVFRLKKQGSNLSYFNTNSSFFFKWHNLRIVQSWSLKYYHVIIFLLLLKIILISRKC